MVPEKDILRYLHVKALAEQGVPGERDNARRILTKLEKKHTGIAGQAKRYQEEAIRKAAGTETQSGPTPPGVHPKAGWSPETPYGNPSTGNWENIFSWAQNVAQGVYGFAQTVSNAVRGRHLATQVSSSVRVTSANNVLVSLKMSMEVYEAACELNVVQLRAFREALHEHLDAELDSIFWEEEG